MRAGSRRKPAAKAGAAFPATGTPLVAPGNELAAGPSLRNPERVAAPTIRGFNYQFLKAAELWFSLKSDEILVCEGNEDVDVLRAHAVLATETQVKDVSGSMTARTADVMEVLDRFISGWASSLKVRAGSRSFVFLTTARLGNLKRLGADSDSRHQARLILQQWLAGDAIHGRDLARSLRSLKHELTAEGRDAMREITRSKSWDGFVKGVYWCFSEPDASQIRGKLALRIGGHGLNPDQVVPLVFTKMAMTAGNRSVSDRTLTALDLEYLLADAAMAAAATSWQDVPRRSSSGIGYGEDPAGAQCAVVVLFSGIETIHQNFRHLAETETQRGRQVSLERIQDSAHGLDWLAAADIQVFAFLETRLRYKKAAFREQVARKGARSLVGELLEENDDLSLDMSPEGHELRAFGDAIAKLYAKAFLRAFPNGMGGVRGRDEVLWRSAAKLRCACDASAGRYYTRDDPPPLTSDASASTSSDATGEAQDP